MVMVDGVPGNGAQAGSVAAVPTTMWGCGGRRWRRRRLFFGLLLLVGFVVALLVRSDWSDQLPKWLWGRVVGLQAENSEFLLEGMPFRILGGSIHYFRIPREYWKDRLLKMRACGLNTLTTYVPWNLHEAKRGKFDFTGNLDLKNFIKTAADVGLWVILRPGPYICSEWDLGGLPSWLFQDPDMKLRTTYKGFTEAVDAYFDQLMKQVVPLQYKKGGPIIAVQVENEYGSYFQDINYMTYMKMALLNRGIVELLMTSDNKDGLPLGLVVGALATINFQKLEKNIKLHLDVVQKNKPMLVMEYWTGWFDSWGGPHHVYDADNMVDTVDQILQTGASINLYMFHGGTNFGFMNGAVHFDRYEPTVTSYDYDALLTEAGDYTSKYFKLRQVLAKIVDYPLPPPPLIPNKASYGVIQMQQYFSLWEVMSLLLEPIKLEQPVSMENLQLKDVHGQAHGYVLYETIIHGEGQLYSHDHVRDRAQVFINTWLIGYLDYTMQELSIPQGQGYRVLRLLVENCGRVNYGPRLNEQRKGLTGDIFLNKTALRNFKIYSLPMDLDFMQKVRWSSHWSAMPDGSVGPAFFRGTLRVHKQALDTFLKPVGWEKGAVFVNGQNLGRYWNIGPQSTLYLPASLLHPGDNEIIIFEERTAGRIIESTDLPFLGKPKYVA